MVLALFFSVII